MKRSYLFLQGVSSPFFRFLGMKLRADGHIVTKINFNAGDAGYWRSKGAFQYRKNIEEIDKFYDEFFETLEHCTDIVLFGDCRPVHVAAIRCAKSRGKHIHVFEEGYFRPFWVTLERDGVNSHSKLPRCPDWYREVGAALPKYANGVGFDSSFFIRAWHDVAYHSLGASNRLLYPGYATHAPFSALAEYSGYMRRAGSLIRYRNADKISCERLAAEKSDYFLFPLQLDSDAQVRIHSEFSGMESVLTYVMKSFSLHAKGANRLVIKNHPLDPGLINYRRLIIKLAEEFDLTGRIVFLEQGNLPTLLDNCRGVVTLNSTVGNSALIHRCPVKCLADPIYNMAGLTFQGQLDEFWRNPDKPDMKIFRPFRNTVIHATQINGGFYSSQGIKMCVENSINSLISEKSPLELLSDICPIPARSTAIF